MKNEVFVVVVSQDGGHGPWSMPVKVSDDLKSAFEIAKTIEDGRGLEFNSIDDDVCIFLMSRNTTYCSCNENLIFVRRPAARLDLLPSLSSYEEWWNVHLVKDELVELIRSKIVQLPLGVIDRDHSDIRVIGKLRDLTDLR